MSKYADQETTRQQAIKLIEWYLGSSGVYWAGGVGGNHDFWGHEHGNVLDFIMRTKPGVYENHGFSSTRLQKTPPNQMSFWGPVGGGAAAGVSQMQFVKNESGNGRNENTDVVTDVMKML